MSQQQQTPRQFPWAPVTLALLVTIGSGLVVAGVYELTGAGWALITAAAPFLLIAGVIVRGLRA